MNIVFWALIIVLGIIVWCASSSVFNVIGKFALRTKKDISNSMKSESEEE